MKLLPEHQKNKKYYLNLLISAYLLYTVSIAIKMVYSAQMVEIGPYFGVDKTQLSIGLTIYYIVYAIAQIAFSFVIKKINIKNFVGITVILSALSFGLMAIITDLWQAWVILAVNGVFQIGIWGGCMKIFGKYMPDYTTTQVTNIMSTGMASGTALAYGFSALFTALLSWKWTFLLFSFLSIATVIYFMISTKMVEKNVQPVVLNLNSNNLTNKEQSKANQITVILLVVFLCVVSMAVSIIYYGLTNWFPNLLKDVYAVPSEYSILITFLVPVGVFFGPFFANLLSQKYKNYFSVGIPLMIITIVASTLMWLFYNISIIFAIVITLIVLFFVRGYMNVLLAYIPLKIRNFIETGKISLIENACACISAAITPFISATIIDNLGWSAFYLIILICAVATLLLTVFVIHWSNKKKIF